MKQENEKVWRKQREKSKSIELASRRRDKANARRIEMMACAVGAGTDTDHSENKKQNGVPAK